MIQQTEPSTLPDPEVLESVWVVIQELWLLFGQLVEGEQQTLHPGELQAHSSLQCLCSCVSFRWQWHHFL